MNGFRRVGIVVTFAVLVACVLGSAGTASASVSWNEGGHATSWHRRSTSVYDVHVLRDNGNGPMIKRTIRTSSKTRYYWQSWSLDSSGNVHYHWTKRISRATFWRRMKKKVGLYARYMGAKTKRIHGRLVASRIWGNVGGD